MDTFQSTPLTPRNAACFVLISSDVSQSEQGAINVFLGARKPGETSSLAYNKNLEAKDQAAVSPQVKKMSPSFSALLPSRRKMGSFCSPIPIPGIRSQCQPSEMPVQHLQKYQGHLRNMSKKNKRKSDFGKPPKTQKTALKGQAENDKGSWILCA